MYVDLVVGLPTSPGDETTAMHAWFFPDSAQAREIASRRGCGIDHLVYICQDLEKGVAAVHKLTGES